MVNKTLEVAQRIIGEGSPCFLVAEAGTTANGEIERAKRLIDLAKEAGFDAIKFQTIGPDANISDRNTIFRYQDIYCNWIEENMYEMFKGLTFTVDEWIEIANYARERDIIFFSTVDYIEGIDIMEKCGVPLHKMGSWDINYEPLIIKAAKTKKPLMVDLGPATISDLIRLVDLHTSYGTGEVIFLHDFHTDDPNEMNMRAIPYLKQIFYSPVGFSAPGRDIDLDIIAIALGADIIEKRITISRSDPGHHHAISLEADELKPWVDRMRKIEACLGSYEVKPSKADLEGSKKYYRSICALRNIKKGEIFSPENLDAKRPGIGIPSKCLNIFYGHAAAKDLAKDTLVNWSDLDLSKN